MQLIVIYSLVLFKGCSSPGGIIFKEALDSNLSLLPTANKREDGQKTGGRDDSSTAGIIFKKYLDLNLSLLPKARIGKNECKYWGWPGPTVSHLD